MVKDGDVAILKVRHSASRLEIVEQSNFIPGDVLPNALKSI